MSDWLNTAELEEATKAIPFPTLRNKDEQRIARNDRNLQIRVLEQSWAAWLANEYLAGYNVPKSSSDIVFQYAWSEGHHAGYHEVENQYIQIADLLIKILKDVNK